MEVYLADIKAEVTAAFLRGEAALVGNDVASLDALFWNSAGVLRLGAPENIQGHEQILAFRNARPSKGLDRTLRNTVITTSGRDFATANTEFTRPGTDRIGRQSNSLARLDGDWMGLEGFRCAARSPSSSPAFFVRAASPEQDRRIPGHTALQKYRSSVGPHGSQLCFERKIP